MRFLSLLLAFWAQEYWACQLNLRNRVCGTFDCCLTQSGFWPFLLTYTVCFMMQVRRLRKQTLKRQQDIGIVIHSRDTTKRSTRNGTRAPWRNRAYSGTAHQAYSPGRFWPLGAAVISTNTHWWHSQLEDDLLGDDDANQEQKDVAVLDSDELYETQPKGWFNKLKEFLKDKNSRQEVDLHSLGSMFLRYGTVRRLLERTLA